MSGKSEILKKIEYHEGEIKSLKLKLQSFEAEKTRKASEQYRKRKKLLEETGEWICDKLKIGDWCQVTGSRAGKYREVIAVNKYAFLGNVIYLRKRKDENGKLVREWVKDMSNVTDHGYNKITHLYVDGEFVPVAKLMKNADLGNF